MDPPFGLSLGLQDAALSQQHTQRITNDCGSLTSQGFIIPKRDTPVEDQILLEILDFCTGVSEGRINETTVGTGMSSAAASSPLAKSTGSAVGVMTASAEGGAFTTIIEKSLNLSAGASSTVSFRAEGTSALAEVVCADPGLTVVIRGGGGVVASETEVSSRGRTIAFSATPGAAYALELRASKLHTSDRSCGRWRTGWALRQHSCFECRRR